MSNIYSLMQTQQPYKSYIKRCVSKLFVYALNPFDGKEEGLILYGDYRKPDEECIYDAWDEKQAVFFTRKNKRHFETGDLVEYTRKPVEEDETTKLNKLSESELRTLLGERFFTIQNTIAKFTSVTPLMVMLDLARELNKSEKVTKLIEAKIAELQEEELPKSPEQ